MRALSDCPTHVVNDSAVWRGTLEEPKNGMVLELSADRPFALCLLDGDRLIPTGRRPDGVLICDEPGPGHVCFIELKGAFNPNTPDRPFEQIRDGIKHFAPSFDHGEAHHREWRAGNDLPTAPPRGRGNRRPLAVGKSDAVAGLILVMRGGTRVQPRWLRIAERDVFVAVVNRHGAHGRITWTLDELLNATDDTT
jgi:hypothetical protein